MESARERTLAIDLEEITGVFIDESLEGLDVMEEGLLNLDVGAADPETMNSIFRAAHSIKGGGATFGFPDISEFAHELETLLDEMRQGERPVTNEAVDLTLKSVDCLRNMIRGLASGESAQGEADTLKEALAAMIAQKPEDTVPADAPSTSEPTRRIVGWTIDFVPHPIMFASGNDPIRIIEALAALGSLDTECRGVDALDFASMNPEHCALSWHMTLDGDIEKSVIEDVFAWVDDDCELQLTAIEEDVAAPAVATTEQAAPSPEPAPAAATAQTPTTAPPKLKAAPKPASTSESTSIRVNIDKVDDLINLVGELVITQSMLSRFNDDFEVGQLEALREGLAQLERNTRDLQESVMAIRMLPISFAFARFPRLVRDTSNALGKKVDLRLSGETTELDKTVLEKIGDPLVHLVRNSLDHGLETSEDRIAAGKPELGVLELSAYHEGGNIVIQVIDDGGGINQEKVLSKARERGLVGADEQLSPERINNLIFMPGFSKVDEVSDLSGRGVGMDVVRRNIADLGGNVSVKSQTGIGSTFTIRLPLTLAILDGQLVRVGDQSYIIPLVSIIETIQTTKSKVSRIANESELFRLRDDYLPILRLHDVFNIQPDSTDIDDGLLVIAEANGQRVGVFVDDLQEQQQVVIKSLESNFRQTQGISGATILGDGTVALIVDVPGLITLFYQLNGRQHIHNAAVA
ncbi:MAG: chemotaxis protein CheA [Pseudomonadota bacterium]